MRDKRNTKKRKLIVSDKLFLSLNRFELVEDNIYECEVIKVSNRYFTVKYNTEEIIFHTKTWEEKTEYRFTPNKYNLYETKEAVFEEIKIINDLKLIFGVIKNISLFHCDGSFMLNRNKTLPFSSEQLSEAVKILGLK